MGANSVHYSLFYSIILIGAFFYLTPNAEATSDLTIDEQNAQFENVEVFDGTYGFPDATDGFTDIMNRFTVETSQFPDEVPPTDPVG